MNFDIISALILKYYYITINRVDRIFDIFYWPVVALLIWGFTSYYLKDIVGNKIIYIFLGGTVLWILFQRATQDISVYILEDFWSRNLFNLFATPIKAIDLIISVTAFGTIRSVITFILLFLLALGLYSFNIFSAGILAVALFSLNLLLTGYVVGLFVSSFLFRWGMRIQVLAWSIPFIVQAFSAVYYPVESLPIIVQKISWMLPTTYCFEGMRYAFETGLINWQYFWTSFILAMVLLIIVSVIFARSIEVARRKGQFVKNE